jgi:predicted secreted protein
MAQPTTRRGTKLRVLQGDGATPTEAFTAYCAINAKEVRFTSQTGEFYVPDCADPDAPAWREIVKSGRAMTVTGSGTLAMEHLAEYQAAYDDDEAINYRVELDVANTAQGGYWAAAFALTELGITGNDADLVTVSITLESNGAVVWVPTEA